MWIVQTQRTCIDANRILKLLWNRGILLLITAIKAQNCQPAPETEKRTVKEAVGLQSLSANHWIDVFSDSIPLPRTWKDRHMSVQTPAQFREQCELKGKGNSNSEIKISYSTRRSIDTFVLNRMVTTWSQYGRNVKLPMTDGE